MKTDELVLSYTQNNISFEFASIHFSRPEEKQNDSDRIDRIDSGFTFY